MDFAVISQFMKHEFWTPLSRSEDEGRQIFESRTTRSETQCEQLFPIRATESSHRLAHPSAHCHRRSSPISLPQSEYLSHNPMPKTVSGSVTLEVVDPANELACGESGRYILFLDHELYWFTLANQRWYGKPIWKTVKENLPRLLWKLHALRSI